MERLSSLSLVKDFPKIIKIFPEFIPNECNFNQSCSLIACYLTKPLLSHECYRENFTKIFRTVILFHWFQYFIKYESKI